MRARSPARSPIPAAGRAAPQPAAAVRVVPRSDPSERAAEKAAADPAGVRPAAGHDFARVRVHTGPSAARAAAAVGALAFTVGEHVVFATGQFAPGTAAGRRLIAHELAHVRQNQEAGRADRLNRYEGFEHRDLGDRHLAALLEFLRTDDGAVWAKALGYDAAALSAGIAADPYGPGVPAHLTAGEGGGVPVTPGQVIALAGDFFANPESLALAPTGEIARILGVMDRESAYHHSGTADAVEYETITDGRMSTLAKRNEAHFAPENMGRWRQYHDQALQLARQSRLVPAMFPRAIFIDSFGGHFLTDAFAAGHVFDAPRLVIEINAYLAAHPLQTQNPEMQSVATLGGMLAGGMAKLVLKNIHDRMNRDGFEVANRRGMTWRTYGDNALARSPETQRVAALAVFLSRRQLVQARAGETPDPGEIEALVPDEQARERATAFAVGLIPQAVAGVSSLIYANRSMLQAHGPLLFPLQSVIGTIGSPGRERQLLDLEESSRTTGTGPRVAPQFTLAEF